MLVSKPHQSLPQTTSEPGFQETGDQFERWLLWTYDSCLVRPYCLPRWVMEGWSPLCAICLVTSDSWLSLSEQQNVWGQSLGTGSKTGKLSDSPRGQRKGERRRGLRTAYLCTCQLVCHRQAKITGYSIIWLKRVFHLRLFKKNPDWNLNLLESYPPHPIFLTQA